MNKYERAAKSNRGRYVGVEYDLSLFLENRGFDADAELEKLAKKYGGEEFGSGAGFGGRDISFAFTEDKKANQFLTAVKKLSKKRKFKLDVHTDIPLSEYYAD